jgi:hypothetical protein
MHVEVLLDIPNTRLRLSTSHLTTELIKVNATEYKLKSFLVLSTYSEVSGLPHLFDFVGFIEPITTNLDCFSQNCNSGKKIKVCVRFYKNICEINRELDDFLLSRKKIKKGKSTFWWTFLQEEVDLFLVHPSYIPSSSEGATVLIVLYTAGVIRARICLEIREKTTRSDRKNR